MFEALVVETLITYSADHEQTDLHRNQDGQGGYLFGCGAGAGYGRPPLPRRKSVHFTTGCGSVRRNSHDSTAAY